MLQHGIMVKAGGLLCILKLFQIPLGHYSSYIKVESHLRTHTKQPAVVLVIAAYQIAKATARIAPQS